MTNGSDPPDDESPLEPSSTSGAQQQERPNVLFVLVDNFGYIWTLAPTTPSPRLSSSLNAVESVNVLFLVPDIHDLQTGGNVFNRRIVEELHPETPVRIVR